VVRVDTGSQLTALGADRGEPDRWLDQERGGHARHRRHQRETGITSINEGTVQLATEGASANRQSLVIRQGGTLDLNGVNTARRSVASRERAP